MYLLDTNAIINIIRTNWNIGGLLYYYSIVSEIELLGFHKINDLEEKILENYCQDSGRINVDKSIKNEIISLRKKYKLKTPDAIICGTALTYDLTLVTNDKQLLLIDEIKCMTIENLINRFN